MATASPPLAHAAPAQPSLQQVVGLVMAATFWATCFAVRPSQTVARPLVAATARSRQGAAMQAAYGKAMAQATATVQRMSWLRAVGGGRRGEAGQLRTSSVAWQPTAQ